jgi:transposase-like protein
MSRQTHIDFVRPARNPESDRLLAERLPATASAHASSHKSASISRMDLIPRGERRRRWTVEQKQTIAAESMAPGASPTDVARRHGIGTGQLYNWRRALMAAQPRAVGRFPRVELAPRTVTARRIAQPPKAAFVTRLRSSRSPDQTARQLPEQSTTLWVEPPSTGETRPRGALHKSRILHQMQIQERPDISFL